MEREYYDEYINTEFRLSQVIDGIIIKIRVQENEVILNNIKIKQKLNVTWNIIFSRRKK